MALATPVVHAVGATETNTQPFESVAHVSMLLELAQTGPFFVHVGSLAQAQLAAPATPPHASCVGHDVVVCTRQPLESGAHVTSDPPLQYGLDVAHSGSVMHEQLALPAVPAQILSDGQVVDVPVTWRHPSLPRVQVTTTDALWQSAPAAVQPVSLVHV